MRSGHGVLRVLHYKNNLLDISRVVLPGKCSLHASKLVRPDLIVYGTVDIMRIVRIHLSTSFGHSVTGSSVRRRP